MTGLAIIFLLVNAVLLLMLPRRFAPMPILVGACYMTLGQGIEIGPFSFTVIRLLVLVGLARVLLKRERIGGGMNELDWLMLGWSGWAIISSLFHNAPSEAIVLRLGFAYNACGIYFLIRVFCRSFEDVVWLCCITAILIVPVAVEMVSEKVTASNMFSALGGVPEFSAIREGKIRAQGPFSHPILAGTVGAVCLPLMIGLRRWYTKIADLGILGCLVMVLSCSSSGPILSTLAAIGVLFLWRYRHQMKLVRWLSVFGYIGLDVLMNAPAYYILARIDISGGSTGWHRARLIEMAILHINEWWLGGTDYTRHWMPTGVSWSPNHTDITNHYIKLGVLGGLPLMVLFIFIIAKGFFYIGEFLKNSNKKSLEKKFMIWCLGASLFAIAATCISVTFFDQSFLFIYMTLAGISSIHSSERISKVRELRRKIWLTKILRDD